MSNEAENGGEPQQSTPPPAEAMPSPRSDDARREHDAAENSADSIDDQVSPRTVPASSLPPPVPIASTSEQSTPSALSQSSDPSFPSSNQIGNGADRSPRPAVTSRSLSFKADESSTWGSFAGAVGVGQSRADAQPTARAASDG